MKRILSVMLVLVCILAALAGCQQETGVTTGTTTASTKATTASSTTTIPTQGTTAVSGTTGNNTTVSTSKTTTQTTVPTTGSSGSSSKPTSVPSSVPTTPTTVAGISLPYTIPGTGLVVEQIAPFDGIYVEDGSNADIKGVAMILLRNMGKKDIDLATITMNYGNLTREFVVSSLPKGMSIVVQEKNKNAMATGVLTSCVASVIESSSDIQLTYVDISVTENSDNSLTIRNLTQQDMPSIYLFYKYFIVDQQLLVGGITFTVNVTDLKAGASITIKPSRYLTGASQIVMIQTYEVAA